MNDAGEVRYNATNRIRGKFRLATDHLRRQDEAGIDRHARRLRMIRLMVMLLGFGFIVWYFFFHS